MLQGAMSARRAIACFATLAASLHATQQGHSVAAVGDQQTYSSFISILIEAFKEAGNASYLGETIRQLPAGMGLPDIATELYRLKPGNDDVGGHASSLGPSGWDLERDLRSSELSVLLVADLMALGLQPSLTMRGSYTIPIPGITTLQLAPVGWRREEELDPSDTGPKAILFTQAHTKRAVVSVSSTDSGVLDARRGRADGCANAYIFTADGPSDACLQEFTEDSLDYVAHARSFVERALASHPDMDIVLTGHSMGGALGALVALSLPARSLARVSVVAFGPCPWMDAYERAHGQRPSATHMQRLYFVAEQFDPVAAFTAAQADGAGTWCYWSITGVFERPLESYCADCFAHGPSRTTTHCSGPMVLQGELDPCQKCFVAHHFGTSERSSHRLLAISSLARTSAEGRAAFPHQRGPMQLNLSRRWLTLDRLCVCPDYMFPLSVLAERRRRNPHDRSLTLPTSYMPKQTLLLDVNQTRQGPAAGPASLLTCFKPSRLTVSKAYDVTRQSRGVASATDGAWEACGMAIFSAMLCLSLGCEWSDELTLCRRRVAQVRKPAVPS